MDAPTSRHAARAALALALVSASACAAGREPPPLRPAPVPWADTLPIPEPGERGENRVIRAALIHAPYDMARPFTPSEGEALNLTQFDDQVPSAWWEPRMGYRAITPAELAEGPAYPAGAPDVSRLVIVDGKAEGVTPGFTAEDAKGDRYIVKFDPPEYLHLTTAASVIVSRLMWGAGYWVPSDYLMVFDPDVLEVAEDAEIEFEGEERAMTPADLDALMARARPLPDGRYVTIASKYVPGIPKGPFFFAGTRKDDPNDHYDHEERRDVRALRVVSAWVNNTDMREGNTLDVYVEPGYLRHYVIDFGATLGSGSTRPKHPKEGMESPADVWSLLGRLVTLGGYQEGWEDDPWTLMDPSLGFLRAEGFDPEGWRATWTNPAWINLSDADGYWAAKIVGSFSNAHIRAAVAEGGLPRKELEDTLVAILAYRRDVIQRHWFEEVSTVEAPEVVEQGPGRLRLAFRDEGIARRVWSEPDTRYLWELERGDDDVAEGEVRAVAGARQQIDVTWSGGPLVEGELLELEIQTARSAMETPQPARVYLRSEGGRLRVVGLMHGDEG